MLFPSRMYLAGKRAFWSCQYRNSHLRTLRFHQRLDTVYSLIVETSPSSAGRKATKPVQKVRISVGEKYRRSALYTGSSFDVEKSMVTTSASSSIVRGRAENASQTRNCLRSCGLVLHDRLLSYIPLRSLGNARSWTSTSRGLRHFISSAIWKATHRNLVKYQRSHYGSWEQFVTHIPSAPFINACFTRARISAGHLATV